MTMRASGAETSMMSPALDQREITPVTTPNLPAHRAAQREFWLVLAALTALYIIAVTIGNRRYVWFDELSRLISPDPRHFANFGIGLKLR